MKEIWEVEIEREVRVYCSYIVVLILNVPQSMPIPYPMALLGGSGTLQGEPNGNNPGHWRHAFERY